MGETAEVRQRITIPFSILLVWSFTVNRNFFPTRRGHTSHSFGLNLGWPASAFQTIQAGLNPPLDVFLHRRPPNASFQKSIRHLRAPVRPQDATMDGEVTRLSPRHSVFCSHSIWNYRHVSGLASLQLDFPFQQSITCNPVWMNCLLKDACEGFILPLSIVPSPTQRAGHLELRNFRGIPSFSS